MALQESCAIAKMTARCALYKYIVRRCGDMAIRNHPRWRRHLGFVRTVNSAIRSAVPENHTLEPNMKWNGSPVAEIWQRHMEPPFWGEGRS